MVMAPMGEQSESRRSSVNSEASQYGSAWTVVSILLSGMLAWGGIGWLVDRWLNVEFFLPFGLILGSVAGGYLAYKRFSKTEASSTPSNKRSTNDGDDDTATADPPPAGS